MKTFITFIGIPLAAGVIYGSWAAYANSEYGTSTMLSAGLAQGFYALFSTWIVTATASKVLTQMGPTHIGMALAFIVTFAVMLAIPFSVHTLLKTPDMWQAITPGLVWGSVYIGGFILKTRNERVRQLRQVY